MAITQLSTLANLLKEQYAPYVSDIVTRVGSGGADLIGKQSFLGLLRDFGRITIAGQDGDVLHKAFEYAVETGTGGASSYGATDSFPTPVAETNELASDEWARLVSAIEYDNILASIGAGAFNGSMGAVKRKFTKALKDLFSELENQLLLDGTGNAGKDVMGIGGFLSVGATFQGINQAVVTGWQSNVTAAAGASLTENMMRAMSRDINDRDRDYNAVIMGTTQYHKLAGTRTIVHNQGQATGELTVPVDDFEGRPIYVLNSMNTAARGNASVCFLNMEALNFRFLPPVGSDQMEEQDTIAAEKDGFPIGIEPESTSTDSTKLNVKLYGNLGCTDPASCGIISGLSTVI